MCVCCILTLFMSDRKHTHVVPLCLLVSGIKYFLTILLNITLFNIIFDWYDPHDQVSTLLNKTALRSLGD